MTGLIIFVSAMRVYVCIYTEILEVNLSAFAYRLFHEDFSQLEGVLRHVERNLHETVCKQMQIN